MKKICLLSNNSLRPILLEVTLEKAQGFCNAQGHIKPLLLSLHHSQRDHNVGLLVASSENGSNSVDSVKLKSLWTCTSSMHNICEGLLTKMGTNIDPIL